MAILTPDELVKLRKEFVKGEIVIWTKVTINAALQEIESWFEANRINLSSVIGTGFTTAQKKKLITYWLKQKFTREGV